MISIAPGWKKKYIRKQSTESVTSSTTLQDDNELKYTFTKAGMYYVKAMLAVDGDGGDFKAAWSVSGGVTLNLSRFVRGGAESQSDMNDCTMKSKIAGTTSGTGTGTEATATNYVSEEFLVTVASTGTLTFQWGQSSSNATPTEVNNNSILLIEKVSGV